MNGEQEMKFRGRTVRAALLLIATLFAGSLRAAAENAPATILPRLAAADVSIGEKVFLQCGVCHVARADAPATIGPNLWNLLGRDVASQPAFAYSDSLRQVGGRWDFEMLNRYLFDPKLLAPEGRMPFPGIKNDSERTNLIAYLRTLSDAPLPLPANATSAQPAAAAVAEDDPNRWDGLVPGPGRDEVFYLCKTCHSLMIVKQQGLSRSAWDETLTWMVQEQGMRPIESEAARERLLVYLSTHFGTD